MNGILGKLTIIPIIASVALATGSGDCTITLKAPCIVGHQSPDKFWAGIDIDVCVGGQESGLSGCSNPIQATCVSGIWVRQNGHWVYSGANVEAQKPTSRAAGDPCGPNVMT